MCSHPSSPSSFVHSAAHAGKLSPLLNQFCMLWNAGRNQVACNDLWPLLLKQNMSLIAVLHTANEKLHLDLMK
jgi:hypothetical protein